MCTAHSETTRAFFNIIVWRIMLKTLEITYE